MDFGYGANGVLDVAGITIWLGVGTPRVVTFYDQTGNGRHYTQAAFSRQPLLDLFNVWIAFNGTEELSRADTFAFPRVGYTVFRCDDKTTNRVFWGYSGGAGYVFGWVKASSGLVTTDQTGGSGIRTTTTTLDVVDGSMHIAENALYSQNGNRTLVDGNFAGATSGSTSGSATATTASLGGWSTALFLSGAIAEHVEFEVDMTDGTHDPDRNIIGNASEYWGTSYSDI